ncbi:MAG: hypothetical protein QF404_04860 [Planctomycetota bacterium]|jgi:hypothetical protein|nr:hypothetical protein [Planctomycetota bacterium]MDP6937484.1 hypothetical protein [Planctomycetota bacterium]
MQSNVTTPDQNATPIVLSAVVLALLAVMALPRRPQAPSATPALRAKSAPEVSTHALREAIGRYHRDHGEWPGLPPHSGLERKRYSTWLVRQLCMASNGNGEVVDVVKPSHPFGPYLERTGFMSPVSGRSDVYLLAEDECMPFGADGHSAWIFDPCSGELHMNAVGCVEATDRRYFDL